MDSPVMVLENSSGSLYVPSRFELFLCDAPNPGGPLTTRQPGETLVNVG